MQQSGVRGVISMFDSWQVWRSRLPIAMPEWTLLALRAGTGTGSSRPLRPARVSSLVRTCAKSAPQGLTADGDCYDPVVNWVEWRGCNSYRVSAISCFFFFFLVLIIHCITWMYDEPDNGGWGFWLSGPEAPRQSLVWMSPVNPPVCGSYYAFISYRAGFSNWAWMKSTKQIKAALCSCCDQWPTGTSRNKTWLAGMDLNSCETIMVESGLVKKTWLL